MLLMLHALSFMRARARVMEYTFVCTVALSRVAALVRATLSLVPVRATLATSLYPAKLVVCSVGMP